MQDFTAVEGIQGVQGLGCFPLSDVFGSNMCGLGTSAQGFRV